MRNLTYTLRGAYAVSAAVVAAVVLAACGSSGGSGSSGSGSSSGGSSGAASSSSTGSAPPSSGSSGGSSSSSSGASSGPVSGAALTSPPAGITAAAGETVFKQICASCHTLAAAQASGTVGPNLDQLKPSYATVVHQVIHGGGAMPAFGSQLSGTQIESVAKFVSSVAGK